MTTVEPSNNFSNLHSSYMRRIRETDMSELLKSLCMLNFSFPFTVSLLKRLMNVLKVELNNFFVHLLSQNFLLRSSQDSKSLSGSYTYQAL
jgi:hypothetical protein